MKTLALTTLALFTTAAAPLSRADVALYANDTPTSAMAMGSRPGSPGKIEVEAADDFILATASHLTSGTFTGLITDGGTISGVDVEIYRVFPNDSTTPASGAVPTRVNSPSDLAFASRDSAGGTLNFSTTTLSFSFSASNSVLNGIHAAPNQTTGGDGLVSGAEVRFNFTLTSPIALGADHYFFVPQVQVSGGDFYWLSASRPTTPPFTPDLQTWIRDANLEPDWLRVGTDIVGGTTPPTFNAAFSLNGTVDATGVPDTAGTLWLVGAASALLLFARRCWFRLAGPARRQVRGATLA